MMNRNYQWTAGVWVVFAAMLTGCNSRDWPPQWGPVQELVKAAVDKGELDLKDHDKNMTDQHRLMSPEVAAKIDALRENFTKKVEENREKWDAEVTRIDALHTKAVAQITRTIARLAGVEGLLPKIEGKAEAAKDQATSAANSAAVADAAAAEAKDNVDEVRAALASLTTNLRDRLAGASAETFKNLEKLRDDDAAFRQALKDDLELTPAQIEELKGMTPNQILAMLAAAGGAAGIGVAGGKGGKSRSHLDIEKLKDTMASISGKIERMRPPKS